MREKLRQDADAIIAASIREVLPDQAVARALKDFHPGKGRLRLVSVGKAGWQMAKAALQALEAAPCRVEAGKIVISNILLNDAAQLLPAGEPPGRSNAPA